MSLLVGSFISLIVTKQKFRKDIGFGITAYLLMISLGVLTYHLHDQSNFNSHYTKQTIDITENQWIQFKIDERLKPTQYNEKYSVSILSFNHKEASGKLLLNLRKDSLNNLYNVGDVLVCYSELKDIKSPLNPNQFDYKSYLKRQYIYHQLYAEAGTLIKLEHKSHSIFSKADQLRKRINKNLKTHQFREKELAIINALLLGQRQDIDRETYNNYVDAGAIHILAISGLHIGIILLILNSLFKPLEYIKYGKGIKVTLLLCLLWSFAIIAGLSASVTRAVTMFSIVAIAMHLNRPTNIYNTLSISIFVLLLIKPMFVFDVGFQMSYAAVFSIVSIQPLFYKLWSPKYTLVDYLWKIFTVSLAAQFGVVPISLFYFHQFPGLFFVSNLIIIPFLGLILGLGLLVILLSIFDALPEMLATILGTFIKAMNRLVSCVSQQEHFIFKDIPFEISHVIGSYIVLLGFTLLIKQLHYKSVRFLLLGIIIYQGIWVYTKYKNTTEAFVIFHKSKRTLLAEKRNTALYIWHNLETSKIDNNQQIKDFQIANFISSTNYDSVKNVYQFKNATILIVDSLGVYDVKQFNPDYVLLRNSPKINLKRLIDSLKPKTIIADGSNYKSYVERWKATCRNEKLQFHSTYETGAYIIN